MRAAQKQPFSLQIKSHPAQLASLNLETKSCLHQILVADLCVAPPKVGCSVAGRQGSRRTRSPPWIVFFWLYSMPSPQDTWKTAHGCSQPKMTCQVLTWAVQFATRIPVIYTLTTFTFHAPRFNFLLFLLYLRNAACSFHVEDGPLSVIKSQGGDVPAASQQEKQHRHFHSYFHILNTWLNFLPVHRPKCRGWSFRQPCHPVFPWAESGWALGLYLSPD